VAPVVLEAPTGIDAYGQLVHMVHENGRMRSSRNGDTLDLGHVITVLSSPEGALPLGLGRNLSRKVAAAEACQLIGGFSDPELMLRASPNFARFIEPGLRTFHGAYGTRIGHQIPAVVHKLTQDPNTRQGVITLWDPLLDNQPEKRDYPCTVMLQFELREDERHANAWWLDMNVVMRSNDVWLGVPYDWFQFTQLQLTLSNVLGVPPGTYTHQSLSTHLYVSNIDDVQHLKLTPTDAGRIESKLIYGFGSYQDDAIFKVMQRARQVTRSDLDEPNLGERWYRTQFAPTPHPSRLAGDMASRGEGHGPAEPVQP
jgi:thymidylate synthase